MNAQLVSFFYPQQYIDYEVVITKRLTSRISICLMLLTASYMRLSDIDAIGF